MEHGRLDFDTVVEAVQPARSVGRHPLFQIMLTHLADSRAFTAEVPFGDGIARVVPDGAAAAKFDLSIGFGDDGSGRTIELEFARDLYDEATAARLLDRLIAVLDGAVDAPETRVRAVNILRAGEAGADRRLRHSQSGARTRLRPAWTSCSPRPSPPQATALRRSRRLIAR